MAGNLGEITFAPKFRQILEPRRYKVFYGGRGGGKSHAIAIALLALAYSRPVRVLCTREYQSSIADSVHKLLCDKIVDLNLTPYFNITKSSITSAVGSEFIFKGLHHNITEIKSLEGIDYCWCEEANSISRESWELLIPTIRKEGSEIWLTFNPVSPDDETYKRFVLHPPEGTLVVKVGWQDNPWFPRTLYEEMERCRAMDPEGYAHIWGGEPRTISDAQIFRGRFEVRPFETPSNARFFHGADWGFAVDPTVLMRDFVDDGYLYIDAEAYGAGVELDETPALFDTIPTARTWPIKADNARPETISYMARKGFRISPAKKWPGSVLDGIALLKSFKKIVIHPRCRHMAEEARMYSYKVDRVNGDILPIPASGWDHCIAGGELVTTKRGEIPIECVKIGDEVFTREGWRSVIMSKKTGVRKIIFIKTEHSSVKCTSDHRIFTFNRGFIEADELKQGDELCLLLKPSNMTGLHGEDTQNQNEEATECITNAPTNINRSGCTGIFGESSMVQFLTDFISTIKMATLRITIFPILNVFQPRNTFANIRTHRNRLKSKLSTLLQSAIRQKLGIAVKRAVPFTERLVAWLIRTSYLLKKYVCNVAKSLPAAHWAGLTAFAPMPANQDGAESKGLMMLNAPASGAGKFLHQTNMQSSVFVRSSVLQITSPSLKETAVYDLTVDGAHEFFVNGLLVHNCWDAVRYSLDGYVRRSGGLNISQSAITRPNIMRAR